MKPETQNLLRKIADDLRDMGQVKAADYIMRIISPTQESGGNNPPPKGDGG